MLTRALKAVQVSQRDVGGAVETASSPMNELHSDLRKRLAEFRDAGEADPFGNPILRMSLELTRLGDRNQLSIQTLKDLVSHMTVGAFARRAERLRTYVGEINMDANKAKLRDLITRVAKSGRNGQVLPFRSFQVLIERFHYGIVFTAHPTFSMPHKTGQLVAKLASGGDRVSSKEDILSQARTISHRPPGVTLSDELASATDAICPSSEYLRHDRGFSNGGSGSSLVSV